MLIRKNLHRDMADLNIYTARRLRGMALSLGNLAQAFADEIGGNGHLTREDAAAAMQTASAAVCGDCTGCSLYCGGGREDSYYLYYLLRTFEQRGKISEEDMPRLFHEICRKKQEYMVQLNRNLGRATMNLSWKNRFLESRDTVIVQFRELAAVLEEFSGQMENAKDVTETFEEPVCAALRRHHIRLVNMLALEYGEGNRELFLTMRMAGGRCMMARDAAEYLGHAVGESHFIPARDSRSVITGNTGTFRFVEQGKYRMLCGAAHAPQKGETVSGDNFTFREGMPGQMILSLSDGMGSGQSACDDSTRVVELTEQLLETGFSARSALKLVNTVLLLSGAEQNPATLDLCLVDLNTGVLEAMKLGAVSTFLLGQEGAEILEESEVPAGVLETVCPVLLSRKLWDNDRIVMMSDGVLEALPGTEKEQTMLEFLEGIGRGNPQEMAEQILEFAASFPGGMTDDMTVLTGGIFKR